MKKLILVAFLTFAAALTPVAAKYAVMSISPLSLAFLRFGVATLLLLAVSGYLNVSFRIDKEDRLMFVILGALVIPINQFFFLEGIRLSVASHSGVLYACTPLIVYLVSIRTGTETYSSSKMVSIFLTVIGIFIIFYENIFTPAKSEGNFLLGDILLFLAVASWAVYLALSKNIVAKYGALKTQTISFLIGITMFIPIFIADSPNLTFVNSDVITLIAYLHLTFVVAFGSYFLYSYSTKIIETSTLTTMTNTSPIITILFSWLLLKENLSYFFIIGASITMAGVFLAQRYGKRSPAAQN